jgi:hypothetical protein
MTTTTIILESDDPSPVLIEDVLVNVYDTGGVFQTSGNTDVDGEAIFDLPDDDYDLTFYKQGVSIIAGMPLRITVDAADTDVPPNTWKVIAHITASPEAIDPLLCRISGYIRGADGSFTKDGKLTAAPVKETGVLGGNVIAPQHLAYIRPDDNGYYEFDLLRGVNYNVYFHFLEELLSTKPPSLTCIVPDLPALPIADFLFPVQVDADFDPEVLAIDVGDENTDVALTITYSDGSTSVTRTASPGFSGIIPESDDEDVATVELLGYTVCVVGIGVGTANITITRTISADIHYDPVPTFTTETLVVTVS